MYGIWKHIHARTYTHARTNTHAHTPTHARTHTHTQAEVHNIWMYIYPLMNPNGTSLISTYVRIYRSSLLTYKLDFYVREKLLS